MTIRLLILLSSILFLSACSSAIKARHFKNKMKDTRKIALVLPMVSINSPSWTKRLEEDVRDEESYDTESEGREVILDDRIKSLDDLYDREEKPMREFIAGGISKRMSPIYALSEISIPLDSLLVLYYEADRKMTELSKKDYLDDFSISDRMAAVLKDAGEDMILIVRQQGFDKSIKEHKDLNIAFGLFDIALAGAGSDYILIPVGDTVKDGTRVEYLSCFDILLISNMEKRIYLYQKDWLPENPLDSCTVAKHMETVLGKLLQVHDAGTDSSAQDVPDFDVR